MTMTDGKPSGTTPSAEAMVTALKILRKIFGDKVPLVDKMVVEAAESIDAHTRRMLAEREAEVAALRKGLDDIAEHMRIVAPTASEFSTVARIVKNTLSRADALKEPRA